MIPSILDTCRPALLAFTACAVLVWMLVQRSGSPHWSRLRTIPVDQRGSVQSLAFVLTFPIFLMLVLFLIQLSQIMLGVVGVHYAAFAVARSAAVWIPAATPDVIATRASGQNRLPPLIGPGQTLTISDAVVQAAGSRKLQEIHAAAALACMSLAPSRDTAFSASSQGGSSTRMAESWTRVIQSLDPAARANIRLPRRLANLAAYSLANTTVDLRFENRSSMGEGTYNPVGHPSVTYIASEVGWQDPVTVTVRHQFALLPGPGRWIVAGLGISRERVVLRSGVYQATLTASATMTVEGLQSLRPTVHAAMN